MLSLQSKMNSRALRPGFIRNDKAPTVHTLVTVSTAIKGGFGMAPVKATAFLIVLLFFAGNCLAQTITNQPASATVSAGQTATFSVGFTGGPCHSVWYTGAGNVYGPTGPSPISYSIPNVMTSMNGIFVEVILYGCSGGTATPLSNSATLTVTPAVPLAAIAISPLTPTIAVGSSLNFTVTGSYTDGSTQNLTSTATWASDTPTVATVNSGIVTAVATGTANISATFGGFTASTQVTVDLASVTLEINSNSKAVFDDGSVILPGPIIISQQQNSTATFNSGVITSDGNGNLSGSLTINPNYADQNGIVTFSFGIPAIPNLLTYPVPVASFQQGSTGLTLNLVLFKKALVVKSQTIALTP
jgi:hypothetical protein